MTKLKLTIIQELERYESLTFLSLFSIVNMYNDLDVDSSVLKQVLSEMKDEGLIRKRGRVWVLARSS